MKKISIAGFVCLMLLLLFGSSTNFTVKSQDDSATIEFYHAKSTKSKLPLKVTFSQEDLAKIKEDPDYLMRKLSSAGVRCCEKRRRISNCVWVCCDRSKVRACDSSLTKALETTWGRPTSRQVPAFDLDDRDERKKYE